MTAEEARDLCSKYHEGANKLETEFAQTINIEIVKQAFSLEKGSVYFYNQSRLPYVELPIIIFTLYPEDWVFEFTNTALKNSLEGIIDKIMGEVQHYTKIFVDRESKAISFYINPNKADATYGSLNKYLQEDAYIELVPDLIKKWIKHIMEKVTWNAENGISTTKAAILPIDSRLFPTSIIEYFEGLGYKLEVLEKGASKEYKIKC